MSNNFSTTIFLMKELFCYFVVKKPSPGRMDCQRYKQFLYVCYTLQEHVKTLYVLHSPFYLLWRSFTCNLDIVSCILTTSSPALFFSALYSSRRPTISTFLDVQGYKLRKLFCFFVFSKYAFVKWKNLLNVECSFGANLEYNRGISGKKTICLDD